MEKLNYYELKPEDNSFYHIIADVTHKCNMKCTNCYIPNRTVGDMDIDLLINCISKFPKRCEIRIIGAEPTLRKDLAEIIYRIRKAGHRPTLSTNGLKLADMKYVILLKEAGLKSVSISMNGADDDDVYMLTDNMRCAAQKIQALHNCADQNFIINTNSVIMKGINDYTPQKLFAIVKNLKAKKIILRFKNVAQIGRYGRPHDNNFSYEELLKLISTQFNEDYKEIKKYNHVNGFKEKNTILFPLKSYPKIYVKITNWSHKIGGAPDPGSIRRGRITEDFKIAPFFEHVKLNENYY